MRKYQTLILLAGSAMALAACEPNKPAAEPAANVAEPAPVVETNAADANAVDATAGNDAASAADGLDRTGNPVGPKVN